MIVWLKIFHIVFMVTWFAVLFMLPRLMVYHVETNDTQTRAKFVEWERRTYLLGHVAFGLMLLFGMGLLISHIQLSPVYMKQGWLHIKLLLVAMLFGYFIYCGILSKKIAAGSNTKSSKWLRLFNEIPAAFLIAIIILVVLKPF